MGLAALLDDFRQKSTGTLNVPVTLKNQDPESGGVLATKILSQSHAFGELNLGGETWTVKRIARTSRSC